MKIQHDVACSLITVRLIFKRNEKSEKVWFQFVYASLYANVPMSNMLSQFIEKHKLTKHGTCCSKNKYTVGEHSNATIEIERRTGTANGS